MRLASKFLVALGLLAALALPSYAQPADPTLSLFLLKNNPFATGALRFAPFANGSEPLTCDSTTAGRTVYTSTDASLRVCNGSTWVSLQNSAFGEAFSAITAGTNTNALLVGNSGTFGPTGTGVVTSNAMNLSTATLTGTVPTARLGSGTANSGTYLRGDQSWAALSSGFDALQTGANTTATMTCGTGCSMLVSGSGTIAATSATNATNAAVTDDTTTNATVYPTWVTAVSGNLPQKLSSTKWTFNPSTGLLTATGFSGPLTGNVTGNVSGTAPAGSLTGATLASGVTASSLTSFGASPSFTTPNIGAATATTINGLTITSTTGTLTIAAGKTHVVSNGLTFTGTDGTSFAFASTGGTIPRTADSLSVFASTTSAQLAGVLSDETGSGLAVFATSPSLTTPNIGVATATSVNGMTLTASTGTFTLTNAKTLTVSDSTTLATNAITFGGGEVLTLTASNALTLTTTGSTNVTLPTSGTLLASGGAASFTTIAASGAITQTTTAIATAQTVGGTWTNTTAALVGAQVQNSPMLVLTGAGWKSNATAASEIDGYGIQARPIAGAAATAVALDFFQQLNNGSYSLVASLTAGSVSGTLSLGNGAGATAGTSVFIGTNAGKNVNGGNVVAIGNGAGNVTTSTGSDNTWVGFGSGAAANSTASNQTFIGSNAGRSCTGSQNAFGGQASGYFTTSGVDNAGWGYASGASITTGGYNAFLGSNAGYSGNSTQLATATASIGLGYYASATASNQMVIGGWDGTRGGITSVYIGRGVTAAAPQSVTLTISGGRSGTDTDTAGASFIYAGSLGTGAGAPGTHVFQTSTTLATGTTAQTLATHLTIGGGALTTGLAPVTFTNAQITTDTGGGVGTAQTVGLTATNTTAAAAGAQQYSPVIEAIGQGWGTGANTSQAVKWGLQVRPVQAATNPTSALDFLSSINGGAYASKMNLTSGSLLTAGTLSLGTWPASSSYAVIGWSANDLTQTSTYAMLTNGGTTILNSTSNVSLDINNAAQLNVVAGNVQLVPASANSRSAGHVQVTIASSSNALASNEVPFVDFQYAPATPQNWATGTLTTQRFERHQAPSIKFSAASVCTTCTLASFEGAPSASTNATITNPIDVLIGGATTQVSASGLAYRNLDLTSHTVTLTGTTQITSTVGGANLRVDQVTYTDGSSVTMDQAASVDIIGAPIAAGSVTITTGLAMLVRAGKVRINDDLQINTAGKTLSVKEGSNACMGSGTLIGGTATITTTCAGTGDRIFITDTTTGALTNVGTLVVSAKNSGNFVVTSTIAIDTSTFDWHIVHAL